MTIQRPDRAALIALAKDNGLTLSPAQADEYLAVMAASFDAYDLVEALELPKPEPAPARAALSVFPKHRLNAWAATCDVTGAKTGPLAGKTVALKDNIMLAGIPMANGSTILQEYVPQEDATVVTRLLAAGARITGKAVCENFCMSGASFTSASGPVLNPHDQSRSAGGSSSGCGALVAAGEVDMAVGGDQGGSIRIPASHCGIVGMKPTWGLVPYTGIMPIEATLDHAGPMTASLHDNALMLTVLAGYDGLDPRQTPREAEDYRASFDTPPAGMTVGILREGFGVAGMQPEVVAAVEATIARFEAAGVRVVEVSIPEHHIADKVWMPIGLEGLTRQMLQGYGMGFNWKGRYAPDLMAAMQVWHERAEEFSDTLKVSLLSGLWALQQTGGKSYAKAQNAALVMRAAYDRALAGVDALYMPTLPYVAPVLPDAQTTLADFMARSLGVNVSTSQFDVTGHPALTVPVAEVAGLPVGGMLVGAWYGESTLYRLAQALVAPNQSFARG